MDNREAMGRCLRAARAAGDEVAAWVNTGETSVKDDAYVGHHAVVTPADLISQTVILDNLEGISPGVLLMTEEVSSDPRAAGRLLRADGIERLQDAEAFIIDELDGTSSYASGHHEWSVSVGFMRDVRPTAGAVCAPRIARGITIYGALGEGVHLLGDGSPPRSVEVRRPERLEDAYVCVGPDCFLPRYPIHTSFVPRLADRVRTLNGCGSCALALAMVAAGQIDALVQPLQSPWDWAAGAALVAEAGGVTLFYELEHGTFAPVANLRAKHLDPTKRSLGFVAGHGDIAREIFDMLAN